MAFHLRQRIAPVHKETSKHFQTGSAKFSGDDTVHSLCDFNVEGVINCYYKSA